VPRPVVWDDLGIRGIGKRGGNHQQRKIAGGTEMRYATTMRTSGRLEGIYIPHEPVLISDPSTACRSNGHVISCDCSMCRELDGAQVVAEHIEQNVKVK
jgi:hypothetical protein